MYSLSEELELTARVRGLNDQLRQLPGNWLMTAGVAEKGPGFIKRVIQGVKEYSHFTEDNDPHGEHDFGSLNINGDNVFWKIDYYEKGSDFQYGSPDPADPEQTDRVLTIMLASEY